MTVELVLGLALALAAVFVATWLLRPELRRRIEQPKHQFDERLRRYDRSLRG